MQIVIDIPRRYYRQIAYRRSATIPDNLINNAIKNGTPLPKGHGRLIDADKLEYTCNSYACEFSDCNHCPHHIITEEEIDKIKALIEEDKGDVDAVSD